MYVIDMLLYKVCFLYYDFIFNGIDYWIFDVGYD